MSSDTDMTDTGAALYDRDFFAWTQDQARRLRGHLEARSNQPLDIAHLAEEIEDMGKRDRRAVASVAALIAEHLLKLEFSPAADPRRGWRETVTRCRAELRSELEDSPSFRRFLIEREAAIFERARDVAESGLERDGPAAAIDRTAPFDTETELLHPGWYPANRHGLE